MWAKDFLFCLLVYGWYSNVCQMNQQMFALVNCLYLLPEFKVTYF